MGFSPNLSLAISILLFLKSNIVNAYIPSNLTSISIPQINYPCNTTSESL